MSENNDMMTTNSGILVDSSVLNLMDRYMLLCVEKVIKYFNLDSSSVMLYLSSSGYRCVEEKIKGKSVCILPFCGSKISGRCSGIKLNYGLYSQCMNEVDNNLYCKTCTKQGEKLGTGKPTYGDISERISLGNSWRDKKGKEAVRYANVMDKLEITREQAEKEARRFGLKIPDIEFETKEVKRGRPKKSVEVSDTDSEKSLEPKKPRGRPPKDKKVVSSLAAGDDLIAGLIKSAQSNKSNDKNISSFLDDAKKKVLKQDEILITPNDSLNDEAKSFLKESEQPSDEDEEEKEEEEKEEEDEEEEEEEVEVEKFTNPKTGIEYYKTEDNILYSMDSEPVGRWNPESQEVEQILDLDEDED